ncbi:hypothetical protein [Aquimarina litoralis]|uniref:hypothetical protein n=1 Tax=Aquimarina litoralis TaxID=584605 RepID=UPI001C58DA89|nr:hypothetical protein [Aquimarina litoralis]MBW1296862.1 hypothetical protein [Aquimarina litoralis]
MKIKYVGIVAFLFAWVLLVPTCQAQTRIDASKMQKNKYTLGDVLLLKLNEEIQICDSLSIKLTYFTHKRPFNNGPTKATAILSLTTATNSSEIGLSIHGRLGQSEVRYDSKFWNGYEFRLTDFAYDDYIKVIIEKREKDRND